MSQFTFKNASCVAIGTFNIYVIQPQTLANMGVFATDGPIPVSGDLTRPGIRFEVAGATWTVRPDRLSVESADNGVDCGEFVKATLEALCWTPIMAIGFNSAFYATKELEEDLLFKLPMHPTAKQRTSHLAIPDDENTINIQLADTEDSLELSINVHSDLANLRNDPRKLSQASVDVCSTFREKINRSRSLAQTILGTEFRYEQ